MLESLGSPRPVDDVPEPLYELGAPVLVFQVIGVLPDIDDEHGSGVAALQHLVVLEVHDGQLFRRVIVRERYPTTGEMFGGRFAEFLAECIERAEIALERLA